MQFIKKIIGSVLRKQGYQAVRTEYLNNFNMTLHLRRLFQSQQIDTVWDVGANRGQYYHYLRQEIEFPGTILSFEPVSELHKRLAEQSKGDPNWHVFPYALGEKQEHLTINVMNANDMSSFLEPDASHTDRFRDSNQVEHTEVVEVKRADDLYEEFAEHYSSQRIYLKMDTQGFDVNVLKGARDSLASFVALQTEAAVLPLYEGMYTYQDMIDYLGKEDYSISGVFPVTVDQNMKLIEFDCVMVNSKNIKTMPVEKY